MHNTYNLTLLRQRILDALPRAPSEAGAAAIEAFLSTPGASAWRPAKVGLNELSYVFDIGVPWSLLGANDSARALALRVGNAVRDGRLPDASASRVVHAGALLTHWGSRVEFADDADATTLTITSAGTTFDVWVARIGDAVPQRFLASERGRVIAAEVPGQHEAFAASIDASFAASSSLVAVLLFEPRFWIGVEQKEWRYLARMNPNSSAGLSEHALGDAIGIRHALRIPLLL